MKISNLQITLISWTCKGRGPCALRKSFQKAGIAAGWLLGGEVPLCARRRCGAVAGYDGGGPQLEPNLNSKRPVSDHVADLYKGACDAGTSNMKPGCGPD